MYNNKYFLKASRIVKGSLSPKRVLHGTFCGMEHLRISHKVINIKAFRALDEPFKVLHVFLSSTFTIYQSVLDRVLTDISALKKY